MKIKIITLYHKQCFIKVNPQDGGWVGGGGGGGAKADQKTFWGEYRYNEQHSLLKGPKMGKWMPPSPK